MTSTAILKQLVAKVDALQALVPKVDALQALVPKVDALQALVPKVDALQALVPKVDALQALVPKVDALQSTVFSLIDKVNVIENKVNSLDIDVKTINNYIKITQISAEQIALDNVIDLFQKSSLCASIKVLQWKLVYFKTNNVLTDLDGCFTVRYNVPSIPLHKLRQRNNASTASLEKSLKYLKFPNNSKQNKEYEKNDQLIIVESKHFLDKVHIDKKILQIISIKEILTKAKETNLDLTDLSLNAKNMINEHDLGNLPSQLVFSCESTNQYVKKYIEMISLGNLNELAYQQLCLDIINRSNDFENLYKEIKHKLPRKVTFKLINEFLGENIHHPKAQYFIDLCKDYTMMQPIFELLKSSICYLVGNESFGFNTNQCIPP
jgi:hypothetical protein